MLVRTGFCKLIIIKTNGYKLHYYPTAISSDLWQYPDSRKYEMCPYIKAGQLIVDVGANIGTTAIPSSKAVGPNGKVFAFEAHPKTFHYLSKNIKLNQLENFSLFNCALGEKNGFVNITNLDADDQNKISKNQEEVSIEMATLDSFMRDIDKIDLLKIDVEGYELFVLQGAKETLRKVQSIYIEISETHFKKYGYSCREILKFLSKYNFQFFKFNAENALEQITIDYQQSVKYENILAIKDLASFEQSLLFPPQE